jgi:iron complex transport system substrate-binding protein
MSLAILSRGFFVGDFILRAMKRKWIWPAAAASCALLMPLLSARAASVIPQAAGTASQESAPASTKGSGARTLTDEAGLRVTIPAQVNRVVSLAPNLTETIYALGLDDKLVGDTSYCDTPPAAKTKPHVGDTINPSFEAIVALHPDLVLATMINRIDTVEGLSRLGIPVYTTDPRTVRGMLESTQHVADLMGAAEKGNVLVTQLQARLDALHARLADRPLVHVLFVVWEDPLFTIGQNTFIADALRWAGAESVVTSKQDWPQLTFEEVVRLQPEYIVTAGTHTGEEGKRSLEEFRTRPLWKNLKAIEAGHVAVVSDEVDKPSPGLIDAIEDLARQLHPEVFTEKSATNVTRMNPSRLRAAIPRVAANEEATVCAR